MFKHFWDLWRRRKVEPKIQKTIKNEESREVVKQIVEIWPEPPSKLFTIKRLNNPILNHLRKEGNVNEKIRKSFKYEPRLEFSEKYLNAISNFGINPEYLREFDGYPFGGFIRDVFHNDIPRDLDILFFNMKNYALFISILQEVGWHIEDILQFRSYSDAYCTFLENDLTRAKKIINGVEVQVDLMFARNIFKASQIDFFVNGFALDLKTEQFFFWNKNSTEWDLYQKAFPFLNEKKNFLNPAYDTGSMYHTTEFSRFRYNRVNEKIYDFVKKGWGFEYNSIILKLHENDLANFISECWDIEIKSYYILKLLTSEKENVREQARFFIQLDINQIPSTLLAHFLKSHYTDTNILVKELG